MINSSARYDSRRYRSNRITGRWAASCSETNPLCFWTRIHGISRQAAACRCPAASERATPKGLTSRTDERTASRRRLANSSASPARAEPTQGLPGRYDHLPQHNQDCSGHEPVDALRAAPQRLGISEARDRPVVREGLVDFESPSQTRPLVLRLQRQNLSQALAREPSELPDEKESRNKTMLQSTARTIANAANVNQLVDPSAFRGLRYKIALIQTAIAAARS